DAIRLKALASAGPSLPPASPPGDPALKGRPPVKQGDVYKAALARPALIGIIDGYFEVTPTVWHKEILWAMAQGIHVYGSASIGALRAAELSPFGMKGGGRIFASIAAACFWVKARSAWSMAHARSDHRPVPTPWAAAGPPAS